MNCENIKAGDVVLICPSSGANLRKATVEKVTPTQIALTGYSRRFRKRDGREIGGSTWYWSHIRPLDAEGVVALERQRLRNDFQQRASVLGSITWRNETFETCLGAQRLVDLQRDKQVGKMTTDQVKALDALMHGLGNLWNAVEGEGRKEAASEDGHG